MASGRILAVDDQRYFRELIEGLLSEEGYEVQTVGSGEEALRALEHAAFDLIITDLVMPVMSGTDLVFRVKQEDPEQDIMVVTGVVDVNSAVEAMKVGATDYLLKPFDREALCAAVGQILQRRKLSAEHDRLLAENLEHLSERALLERALELMAATSHEALAEGFLDGLCEEAGAQGGILWRATGKGAPRWRMAAARGLVRTEDEPKELTVDDLPPALAQGETQAEARLEPDASGAARPALWVALRASGELVAAARLTDKLGGERFDDVDRAGAAKLASHAATAYRNVERAAGFERRSFQDPDTHAYCIEYLHDVVRNEIEKANRFGTRFGLLHVGVAPLQALRERLGEGGFRTWHARWVRYLARFLRSTDLLAVEDDGRVCVLLAETDAVGAATFKQRIRAALMGGEPMTSLARELRPGLSLGCVTYPGEATQLEGLLRALGERELQDRHWRDAERQLAGQELGAALTALLEGAAPEPVEGAGSLLRFLVSELGRRPRERNLLFCRPGPVFDAALIEGLRGRRNPQAPGELVVIGEPGGPGLDADQVTWVSSDAVGEGPPFAVQFGDGPPYVWVADPEGDGHGPRLFHSADRALAETLAFRLQRELHVGLAEGGVR